MSLPPDRLPGGFADDLATMPETPPCRCYAIRERIDELTKEIDAYEKPGTAASAQAVVLATLKARRHELECLLRLS